MRRKGGMTHENAELSIALEEERKLINGGRKEYERREYRIRAEDKRKYEERKYEAERKDGKIVEGEGK